MTRTSRPSASGARRRNSSNTKARPAPASAASTTRLSSARISGPSATELDRLAVLLEFPAIDDAAGEAKADAAMARQVARMREASACSRNRPGAPTSALVIGGPILTAIMSGCRLSPSRTPASKPPATTSAKRSSMTISRVMSGKAAAKAPIRRREDQMGGRPRHGDAQIAGRPVARLERCFERQLDLAQRRPQPFEQCRAGLRRGNAARGSRQQPHAEPLLQARDRMAHRRGRDRQAPSRRRGSCHARRPPTARPVGRGDSDPLI